MGEDNDPPKNPFIRWKQHVDTHIGTTLHGLLGIPNMVSKNLNIRGESDKGPDTSPASGTQPSSSSNTSQSPAPPQTNDSYHSAFPPHSSLPSDNDDSLDGVDASQLLAWHKFIYYSPYSPLKLQQQQQLHLLPPPVPQDVPFGADPFAFTYADAFEDLLRSSSGRPLLDLADRSYRNLRYQMRYGSAIEPPYVFFHRMHSQRLLDAYFPRSSVAGGSAEAATGEANTPRDDVVRAVAALAERDRDLWREQLEEEDADKNYENEDENKHEDEDEDGHEHDAEHEINSGQWDDDADVNKTVSHSPWNQTQETRDAGYGGRLFDELDRVFRVLNRIIREETGGSTDDTKTDGASAAEKNEPSAEDELYNAVRSAYANAEKSLGTLIKSFSGGFDAEGRCSRSSSSSSSSTTETSVVRGGDHSAGDGDGRQGETIQTTEEHVDAFGNRHVKITVQRLDADGNEVARETRYTIRSQSPQEAAASKELYDSDDDESNNGSKQSQAGENIGTTSKPSNNNNDGTKNSGWFWK
ncbi:uncharacterized protein SPSK_07432 [Sporothrix schenckii 1099-18]|uniref:Uncharacterized protein n=2 Tax=Sporothrix schenckii TaxID=29908 RepID=U7Q2T5_SPOS1|nr:uncharacterized protein SPSK_07432 [Sporothrix schenckii 1099-18]ERT01467.1 hypothetical protein HMPREF1624_02716 [Sporothrix schenckii ATCC 58251]KJR88661.1 hypothetical protein SPSK_07432 [Sporothrix schenckii 1099-18]